MILVRGICHVPRAGVNHLRHKVHMHTSMWDFLLLLAPNFASAEGTDTSRDLFDCRVQQGDEVLMDYFNSKYTLYQHVYPGNPYPADHFYLHMVSGPSSPKLRVYALDLILKPEEVAKHHYQPAAYLRLLCSAASCIQKKVKYDGLDRAKVRDAPR